MKKFDYLCVELSGSDPDCLTKYLNNMSKDSLGWELIIILPMQKITKSVLAPGQQKVEMILNLIFKKELSCLE